MKDLNYLLSGKPCNSIKRVKKKFFPFYQHPSVTVFSQLGLNDCYPVTLSSLFLLFLWVWSRALESGKSKRWKSSQTETKGDRSRARKRWGKLIGFAKSSSNSRSQCGSTKRPLPVINLNLFYPSQGNQLGNLIWLFWFTA